MAENGARHAVVDVGAHDHNASVREALPRVVDFFEGRSRVGQRPLGGSPAAEHARTKASERSW
ncbi:hypothetical protein [Streptomyces sp. NPDC049906]|uniref:hypothetical protein n=1 Tax=Streptomyces sp. NPDC049906 TaxID=3155656 RepID=UPI00343C3CC1